ncbi:PQQ-binding-like beta-propeller repeat protein [Candidatus Binatia bacterium]|jgi:outer membrane protein assembly factor BamB|nr:PQQ-binding-like beta-propeller repeat protein [Candidatus Binatia bacterium]
MSHACAPKIARHWWPRVVAWTCGVVSIGTAGRTAHARTWRQPGHAATRSSYAPRERTIDASNVATLVERWRVPEIDAGAGDGPVAAAGRVFVTSGDELVALTLADGAELWRSSAEHGGTLGSPVLTPDGKVTTSVTDALGFSSGIGLFERVDGSFTTGVGGGVHAGRINPAVAGTSVFAFDYVFGSGGPWLVSMVPYPGIVFLGGSPPPSLRGPVVGSTHAFVGLGSILQAFDRAACPDPIAVGLDNLCSPAWSATFPGALETPVAFRHSVVTVAGGTLQVREASNGDVAWSATIAAGIGHAPAVARRRIFVPTERGVILAFATQGCGGATCSAVERLRTGSPPTGQPVVAQRPLCRNARRSAGRLRRGRSRRSGV